jgi:hypothetical protein
VGAAYREETMRRLVTLALALGLAALVAVAAVDALRETDDSPPEARVGSNDRDFALFEGRAAEAARLRRLGVSGRLYLSADMCGQPGARPIRILRLPELELERGLRWPVCSFSLSDDEERLADGTAVWSPRDPVFATWTRNTIELTAANTSGHFSLAGSAPAFKRDGTFTHVRDGEVVEWTSDCAEAAEMVSPPVPLGADPFGPYCPHRVITRSELGRALPKDDRLQSVDALVWADDKRLLANLRTAAGSWLAAYENGRSLGYANGLFSSRTKPPLADPNGDYLALGSGGFLEVFDRNAGRAWESSLQTLAYDWSPDGSWLAVAAPTRIHLVRTSDWTSQFTFPLSTESLAWRQ